MSTYSNTARGLLTQGVAHVPFNERYQELAQEAAQEWLRILATNPTEIKNIDTDGYGEPEHGWLPKSGEKHELSSRYQKHDQKDPFHFHAHTPDVFRERDISTEPYEKLFALCAPILEASMKTLYGVAHELDKLVPGYGLERLMHESDDGSRVESWHNHTLRVMTYHTVEDELVGKLHTDRDLLTLHIADSDRGLIAADGTELRVKQGQALVFAGDKMPFLTNGTIPTLPHGVRNNEKQRWVVVCFGQTPTELPLHEELRALSRKKKPAA